MKKRSPIAATLLSMFIPFYFLYWLYDIGKTMRAKGVQNVPRIIRLFVPLILSLLLLPLLIVLPSLHNDSLARILIILVALAIVAVSIVVPIMYYYLFSAAAEAVTNKELSKWALFILFMFLAPVSVYLIQDKLNASGGTPLMPAVPSTPATPASTPPSPDTATAQAIPPQANPLPPAAAEGTPPAPPAPPAPPTNLVQ